MSSGTQHLRTVSNLLDTVDMMYVDPYLAIPLMYISWARKALSSFILSFILSRTLHPLHSSPPPHYS